MQHVIQTLASAEMRGRGFGTPELDRPPISLLHSSAPLAYSQPETRKAAICRPGASVVVSQNVKCGSNVVGFLPGTEVEVGHAKRRPRGTLRPSRPGVVDVHQEDIGKIHPGADDNASGVAVLLELAHVLVRPGAQNGLSSLSPLPVRLDVLGHSTMSHILTAFQWGRVSACSTWIVLGVWATTSFLSSGRRRTGGHTSSRA